MHQLTLRAGSIDNNRSDLILAEGFSDYLDCTADHDPSNQPVIDD